MSKLKAAKAKELLSDVQSHYAAARSHCLEKMDQWMECMAFYRGLHYSVRNGVFWSDVDENTGEAREVHNYLQAFVRAGVANRIKAFPNPQVPAANGDQRSLAKAQATEKLLRSFIDDDIISKEELVRCLTAAAILGAGWLKIYWDPFAGKPRLERPAVKVKTITDELTGETMEIEESELDIFGEPILSREFEGKICVEYVSLLDGMCDPTARKLSEARFFIHRKRGALAKFKSMFPNDYFGQPVQFDSGDNDHAANIFGDRDENEVRTAKEGGIAQIVEYWEAPSEERPNGMLVVYSGNSLIHIGANPYRPCRLPVELLLGDNMVPDGLFADGTVKTLIPLQKTLNRVESKKREWIDKIVTPHVLNPLGSGVSADSFGEIIGQVINYAPGLRPEIMQVPPIPGSMFDASAELVGRMKEISTYSDISRGDFPSGDISGRAIAFATENEQNIREPDMILHRQCMLNSMKQCLWLAKQFYETGRMVRTLGEDGWEFMVFDDTDFDWYVDLAPEPMSGAPNSRALRWAETMEAFAAGLFNDDAPGAKEVRRMLEVDHSSRSTVDKNRKHRNLARWENIQVVEMSRSGTIGEMNEVREFHDDVTHMEEHDDFRNSMEYLMLPPELRSIMDAHCEWHEDNLHAKQQVYAEDQGMLQGSAGGAPAAPAAEMSGIPSPLSGGAPAGEPAPPSIQDQILPPQ